jgi:hypothetical protein
LLCFYRQGLFVFGRRSEKKYCHNDESKKSIRNGKIDSLKGEFYNELLNASLRIKLSERHKDIRKYIVEQALFSAAKGFEAEITAEKSAAESSYEAGLSYKDDPLGIAIPWEDKYGKENKKN